MLSFRFTISAALGVLAVAACNSSSSTGGDGSATAGDDGGAEATGDAADSASSGSDASDALGDAPPPPCPDVQGAYSITAVQGQGCGSSFGMTAPQCIVASQQARCGIFFASMPDAGNVALNGSATLQNDGSFSGAAITEGTLGRTGCTGSWTATSSTLRVDCGGVDSGQACVLDLVRTGSGCP